MEQEMNAPPSATGARQFAKVCEILERHQRNAARLIPILQEVQAEYRYLPEEVLTFVATSLGLPPARVFGVATFFSHFTLTPRGKYTIDLASHWSKFSMRKRAHQYDFEQSHGNSLP